MERVTPALELGEGPHWNPQTKSLYFVDLHRGKINRYYPETKEFFSAIVGTYFKSSEMFFLTWFNKCQAQPFKTRFKIKNDLTIR